MNSSLNYGRRLSDEIIVLDQVFELLAHISDGGSQFFGGLTRVSLPDVVFVARIVVECVPNPLNELEEHYQTRLRKSSCLRSPRQENLLRFEAK